MKSCQTAGRRCPCGVRPTVWLLLSVGIASAPMDARFPLRVMQDAPEPIVQTPSELQLTEADDVGAPDRDGEAYTYEPERRRDPFVSLLARRDRRPLVRRPAGLAGLGINEVALRGLVLSGGVYRAVMEAPDSKTYILRGGERLFDGVVKSVSAEGVTFLQRVDDPRSLETERIVHRMLRGEEER